jgi:hypothetical protein
MVPEIVENSGDYIFTVHYSVYCLPLLFPEHACSFTILSAHTSPKHPAYFPLLFIYYAGRVKELRGSNFACAPLPFIVSGLTPALIAPADLIPLLISPREVLFCPSKTELLIGRRDR